jgi:hypothetical protein
VAFRELENGLTLFTRATERHPPRRQAAAVPCRMFRCAVPKAKPPYNPFYALLVIVGVAFTITACAYALMMVRASRPDSSVAAGSNFEVEEQGALMKLLDERGMEIMGVEVLILGVATVGAIALDQWRSKRDDFSQRDMSKGEHETQAEGAKS